MDLLTLKGHYHALVNAQQLNTVDEIENENEEKSEGQSYEALCNMRCKGHCRVSWDLIFYLNFVDCLSLPLPPGHISFSSFWGFSIFIASMFLNSYCQ
jgi:hypothetical protein